MKFLLTLTLLALLLLAACQPAAPTPTAAPATEAPAVVEENYPAPQSESAAPDSESYPAPEELQSAQPSGSVLYPDPKDGDEVTWVQAVSMLLNGEVTQINQEASQSVVLLLKDGRSLRVTDTSLSPEVVQQAVTRCGEICQNIEVTAP
jgi:hypothetical protein